jgi:hypothetical protein
VKLPESRKERTKILCLVGLAAIAVIYGATVGLIKPFLARKRVTAEKIRGLKADVAKADAEISKLGRIRATNAVICAEVLHISENFLLHPRLGNYLLGAKETVQRHAATRNLDVKGVDEVGVVEMPKPKAAKGQTPGREPSKARGGSAEKKDSKDSARDCAFKSYAARVNLAGGFQNLTAFLEDLEKENPYVSVAQLSVTVNPEDPCRHKITANIQWPIWADARIEPLLRRQMAPPENEEK